jgi:AmmeMemoRadiSam system protein B
MGSQGRYARTRPAAVGGYFYPGRPEELARTVDELLDEAAARDGGPLLSEALPTALIVPHAGYVYSGPIAASAYAQLRGARDRVRRVVLLGPAHRVPVDGLADAGADALATPLGDVEVDRELARLAGVPANPRAHAQEHSLEVQLPFLQRALPGARVVPLLVGDADPDEVAAVIEALWGGPETLIVISSDLSHYHPYEAARALDDETARRIESLDERPIAPERACGAAPINGLLRAARARGMRVRRLDLRSSGDTAGPRDQVVGYGAFAITGDKPPLASGQGPSDDPS